MLYPQNGDRIVAMDSVTSVHQDRVPELFSAVLREENNASKLASVGTWLSLRNETRWPPRVKL